MTNFQHYGIVVHTNMPHKKACLMLDYKLGLLEAIFFHQPCMERVHHGMLLEYSLTEKINKYKIDAVNILAIPQSWVTDDIKFFHAVLHAVSHCMMQGSHDQNIFSLLMILYRNYIPPEEQESPEHEIFKVWFLCRLKSMLGIYPENHRSFDATFFTWISCSNTTFHAPEKNTPDILLKLNIWLEGCKI